MKLQKYLLNLHYEIIKSADSISQMTSQMTEHSTLASPKPKQDNIKISELISVVVPVYNATRYLREALESLCQQTYANFEAILVNDGSTDDSESICMEFCETDNRFHLISQKNSGVSAARNTGIDTFHGEWIAFMDADDLMMPDTLETLLAAATKSNVRIAIGNYTRSIVKNLQPRTCNQQTIPSEKAIEIGLYQKRILNNPWGVLFHKYIFNGEMPLRFRKCRYEDLDLFYQAFERSDKICILDQIVYYYRDTPGSFINTWSESRLDALDVTDRMVQHYQDKNTELLKAATDRRFSAHFNILMEMERHNIDNPIQKERCWKVIKNQRFTELTNPNVRLKNKLGALISYFGMPAIRLLCKF